MTAYTWIGGTGDWDLAGNWRPSSPAGPPKATDTATISATGPAYTVAIDTPDVAKSLTEKSASATVDDTGSLTLSRTFTLSAGTFILGSGGTLSGSTTRVTGGTFVCDGGALSGVTYDGTLDLSGSGASVHLASGTVVNDAAGSGAGTINDTGTYSTLYFDNTQTFNNATIDLGNTSGYASHLSEYDSTGAGTVLTLGPNVTINESFYGSAQIETGSYAGDGIVNEGNINQTASGGTLYVFGNSFTNSGTISASANDDGSLTIESTTFTNNGAIDISNGDAVAIVDEFQQRRHGRNLGGRRFAAVYERLPWEQSRLDHARQRFLSVFGRQFHARRLGNTHQFGCNGRHCRDARQHQRHPRRFECSG
jgi:hypothetical protein